MCTSDFTLVKSDTVTTIIIHLNCNGCVKLSFHSFLFYTLQFSISDNENRMSKLYERGMIDLHSICFVLIFLFQQCNNISNIIKKEQLQHIFFSLSFNITPWISLCILYVDYVQFFTQHLIQKNVNLMAQMC